MTVHLTIHKCGECPYCERMYQLYGRFLRCSRADGKPKTKANSEPPAWCPLRKEEKE